jgi:hypothetical protein
LSAKTNLISFANIVFLVTGIYFAGVAGAGQGSIYTLVGALLCFVSVGLALEKDWFFSEPWRVATAAFSMVILVAQLGADFTVSNLSAAVAVSVLLNGVLFVLIVGVLLFTARDLVRGGEEQEEEEPEEQESKKKKLTYEI